MGRPGRDPPVEREAAKPEEYTSRHTPPRCDRWLSFGCPWRPQHEQGRTTCSGFTAMLTLGPAGALNKTNRCKAAYKSNCKHVP
jgi:hypothetical protein